MRVYIPKAFNASSMYHVLGQVFDEDGVVRSDLFTFEFASTQMIDAVGIVVFDIICNRLVRQGIDIETAFGKLLPAKEKSFLAHVCSSAKDDCDGLLRMTGNQRLLFRRISLPNATSWFLKTMNNWLGKELYSSSLVVAPQTHPFLALIQNAQRYAGVSLASILVSVSNDGVKFIIADSGRGIPATIRRVWRGPMSDHVALAKAIEAGKITSEHPGFKEGGLGKLVAEVVDVRRGSFTITSGFGRIRCAPHEGGKTHQFEPANAFFPGTMIEADLALDTLGPSSTLNEPAATSRFILK